MSPLEGTSDAELTAVLHIALASVGIDQPVRSLRRAENTYESSHRSEVLDCILGDGLELRLLCKHGPSHDHDPWGLRRGLAYEAIVYREALSDEYAVPRFYGSHDDPQTDQTWLLLEHLGEGWQLDLGPDHAILDAAAMLGEIHRHAADRVKARALPSLNRYDRRYFSSCLERAATLSGRWRTHVPAYDRLLERFAGEVDLLLSVPQTLIHGEFTPQNVVWAEERPHAIDWEEAAIGPGEIDFASLTDGWDEELVVPATRAYLQSRWPQGPPYDFDRVLEAARRYWVFRWVGLAEETETPDQGG